MDKLAAVSDRWCRRNRLPRRFGLGIHIPAALVALGIMVAGGKASAANVGPSFPCSPLPTDALAQLTCSDQSLAEADIRLVQTYYALRQFVGPDGQKPLKTEFLSYVINTRQSCGLPPVEPRRDQSKDPLPANAASCVAAAYDGQRATWARSLSGPAAEEAARPPEQNLALQGRLQTLGFLPKDTVLDGVFGTGTRGAVMAWHHASGRPETSFLSDADAVILLADASPSAPADPWAALRAKPFAQADYRGKPLTVEYKNLQVSIDTGVSHAPDVCENPDGGILSFGAPTPSEKGTCRAVFAKIAADGKEVATAPIAVVDDESSMDLLDLKVAIQRLDTSTALPQVVITGYSGGAHCCTSTVVATVGLDGTWKFVKLGSIDGDQGFAFLDLDHDGSSVLVDYGDGFNYEFASYAGSFAPTRIQKFSGDGLHDVTKEPRYRSFLLDQLRRMEREASRNAPQEPNGYLAGWVAEKALVGQFDEGWRTLLSTYDRDWTSVTPACAVDKSVWAKGQASEQPVCPEGQELQRRFPEALALHLVELGYITPEQSAAVGYDPAQVDAQRKEATSRYADQVIHGWFVITHSENCALAPSSPADMITTDRARSLEDIVNVLENDGDGKPLAVRVEEPEANGLVSMLTFYRGAAKCEATRQNQKARLDNLK